MENMVHEFDKLEIVIHEFDKMSLSEKKNFLTDIFSEKKIFYQTT